MLNSGGAEQYLAWLKEQVQIAWSKGQGAGGHSEVMPTGGAQLHFAI